MGTVLAGLFGHRCSGSFDAGWYFFDYRNRPQIVSSSIHDKIEAIDTRNAGFHVLKRTINVNLRNEVPLAPELRDVVRMNPSVQEITLDVMKTKDAGRWLSYQLLSQRQLNEVFPLSQQRAEVRFERLDGIQKKD